MPEKAHPVGNDAQAASQAFDLVEDARYSSRFPEPVDIDDRLLPSGSLVHLFVSLPPTPVAAVPTLLLGRVPEFSSFAILGELWEDRSITHVFAAARYSGIALTYSYHGYYPSASFAI
jgi:hypothetical protein